jgi:hypothetical protein
LVWSATACCTSVRPWRGAKAERRDAPGAPCFWQPRSVLPSSATASLGLQDRVFSAGDAPPKRPAWLPSTPGRLGAQPCAMSQHRAGAGESPRPAPIGAHNGAPTPQSRSNAGLHTAWRFRRAREPRRTGAASHGGARNPASPPRPRSTDVTVLPSLQLHKSVLAPVRRTRAGLPHGVKMLYGFY